MFGSSAERSVAQRPPRIAQCGHAPRIAQCGHSAGGIAIKHYISKKTGSIRTARFVYPLALLRSFSYAEMREYLVYYSFGHALSGKL